MVRLENRRRLQVVVVDDEAVAVRRMCRLLADDPEVEVVAECCDGKEALQVLLTYPVDILFLDVQIPELDGFEMLRALPEDRLPVVVFVTAYDQYAIEAFEASATDYLLKPFHRERFAKALGRAKARVPAGQALAAGSAAGSQLVIRTGRSVVLLNYAEIDWIEAANNYVCVHCGSTVHVTRETLAGIERRLPGRRFARIHRSLIVHLAHVRTIEPLANGDGRVVLRDGTRLAFSRTFRENLERFTQIAG
jgi:two-component system LytT family response regulator